MRRRSGWRSLPGPRFRPGSSSRGIGWRISSTSRSRPCSCGPRRRRDAVCSTAPQWRWSRRPRPSRSSPGGARIAHACSTRSTLFRRRTHERCAKIVEAWRLGGGGTMRLSIARGFGHGLSAAAFVALAACSGNNAGAPAAPSASASVAKVTAFTGARLIVGDGTVIENATFTLGADKHFGLVGNTAAVTLPAGVTKVDLTGLTVMPAIVDAHTHLSRERDALIADLKHRAYFGVSAALSLGQDDGTDVFVLRKEVMPGSALYRLAGRGITAPEPGRNEIPYWVTTEDEARAAVREQPALGVDIIKIWVDDRLGKYKKLSPEIYGAAIDEAHKAGLRAIAHEYYLADAKELLRRGIDAFAHGVRDTDVDDEFVALVKAHPGFVLIPNLPERGVATDLSWLAKSLPPAEVEPLQAPAGANA